MSDDPAITGDGPMDDSKRKQLFWACWIALVATAFGFIVRALIIDEWATQFGLTETQKGEIFGVGLWPFAISIVLFSLIIDKIGYGKAMAFAFVAHVASAVITILTPTIAADGDGFDSGTAYNMLYLGNFIVALANGTVEAVINPVVATLFSREKTKWLNILHAGWPGGLVIGGLIVLLIIPDVDWRIKVGLILVPTVLYGILMIGKRFPANERVASGVSYNEMLREFGVGGAFLVSFMIFFEVGRVFNFPTTVIWGLIAIATIGFGFVVRFAIGRPLFLFLLCIMVPLATTELGVDSWVSDLMTPEMKKLGLAGGWVLVYTSLIMMVLRFFPGPIVHAISPLGLLAASSVLAALGLVSLSSATGVIILAAATLYALGKTFFWPTMLGVVAEQFPRGGALTLNATGGVGMLGVGVVGAVLLGFVQEREAVDGLALQDPAVVEKVVREKEWVFGTYEAVDPDLAAELGEDDAGAVEEAQAQSKKAALSSVAILPCIMFVCYVGLLLYFRSKGGYDAEVLAGKDDPAVPDDVAQRHAEEVAAGAVEGPVR